VLAVVVVASGCFAAIAFGLEDALPLLVVWPFGPLCGRCFATKSVLARLAGGCLFGRVAPSMVDALLPRVCRPVRRWMLCRHGYLARGWMLCHHGLVFGTGIHCVLLPQAQGQV